MLKPLSKWKVVTNVRANLNSVILQDFHVRNLNFKIFYSFCVCVAKFSFSIAWQKIVGGSLKSHKDAAVTMIFIFLTNK